MPRRGKQTVYPSMPLRRRATPRPHISGWQPHPCPRPLLAMVTRRFRRRTIRAHLRGIAGDGTGTGTIIVTTITTTIITIITGTIR